MDLIKSGVPGLDEVLKGGIRKDSSILVCGGPGTGKTIFAIQFIYQGLKNNEPCLYITSEETKDMILDNAKSISLDLTSYKDKLLTIYEQPISGKKILSLETPLEIIKRKKIKRVVLDSLTLFEFIFSENQYEFRKGVITFVERMKKAGVTVLVTSERSTIDLDKFEYKPEDFLFEGLIVLTKIRKGSSFERTITVAKMRGQDHLIEIFPFTIQKKGITVHTKELPFSLLDEDNIKGRSR